MSYLLKMLNCKHYDTLTDRHPPKCKWLVYQWLNVHHIYNDGIKKTSTTSDQDNIILLLIICVSTLASVAIRDIASMLQELPRYLFLYILYIHHLCPQCEILPQCIFCASHTAIGGWRQANDTEQCIRFVKNKIKAENTRTLFNMLVLYTVRL